MEDKLDKKTTFALMTTVMFISLLMGFFIGMIFTLIGLDIVEFTITKLNN